MAISAEALLISSVLRERDYTNAVSQGIDADYFHAYQDEWKWIEKYFSKYRKVPSKVAFKRHFPEFRVKAVNDTEHFVDEVRKAHSRITLTSAMSDVADMIAEGEVDKAIRSMQQQMVQMSAQLGGTTDVDILNDWENIYADIEYRKAKFEESGMAGIPTGFDTLDDRTGGYQPGQLWIVGARLGEGKSWTLMRSAVSAIMAGHKVHYAALEMSTAEVAMRIHNFLSGSVGKSVFQSRALSQGRDFDLSEYREFLRSLKTHISGSLIVSDNQKIGAMEIAAQIERHKPDIYFLDYLTLAKTGGDGGWQDIGRFSKDLKLLAKEYKIPIVAAAQLNRANGLSKEVPGAESLAQSDAIGQDADAVVNLKKRSERVTEFYLAKYRHGTAGYKWHSKMDMNKGIFNEISYNDAMDLIQEDRDNEQEERENS